MLGMQIKGEYLVVKQASPPTEEEIAHLMTKEDEQLVNDTEIFRQVIDDRPSPCLILHNIVNPAENQDPEDYKELEFDV